MKREASNEVKREADAGERDKSRDAALLSAAILLVIIYLLKEFYISKEPVQLHTIPSAGQTVFEIEDSSGFSKVYIYPEKEIGPQSQEPAPAGFKRGSEVKTGSRIIVNQDGALTLGFMSGEKHLIFSIPLDINRATVQDFEALPGIGPKLAREIVETRERLGGFKTIDDLKRVKGIGDKKFGKIRDKLIS